MTKLTMIISGMTCGGCVKSVTRVLEDLPGVANVSVSLIPSQAKLEYDPSRIGLVELQQAVADAGFAVLETRT